MHCPIMYSTERDRVDSPAANVDMVMNGLRWPPDAGPAARMKRETENQLVSDATRDTPTTFAARYGPRAIPINPVEKTSIDTPCNPSSVN